ncbi:ribbon-helix-helix domain-containing protein [Haloparvum sedimenti]|uniref:ribbon-helix-helix domain-containing protein n=1 Tax=Haloparvum sedimenti TaxID=1678448 RepID=UPI00071E6DC3|nr:ribbon-helix-helix domain-containing protein [Haloparvum sedimenti]
MAEDINSGEARTRVTFQLSDRRKMELNRIAYDLSEPGDSVSQSELVREAVEDLIEKYADDPTTVDPRARGSYGGQPLIELETDEGAA